MINDKQETMRVEQHNHRARPYWDGRFVVPLRESSTRDHGTP